MLLVEGIITEHILLTMTDNITKRLACKTKPRKFTKNLHNLWQEVSQVLSSQLPACAVLQ